MPMEGSISSLLNRPAQYIVLCGLVLAVSGLIFLNSSPVMSQLNAWKLLPRPERLTELYFTDPTRLPVAFTAGSKQAVRFAVHNLEHRETRYHYVLTANTAREQRFLGEGDVTLAHDSTEAIARVITVPALGPAVAVQVKLSYNGIALGQDSPSLQHQSIRYWVNRAT